ncbi:MAG: hypothetical protein IPL28_05995 [Chloroflexi bacterium]|nr:hypothetical protein [Chloroflexota bacterium]
MSGLSENYKDFILALSILRGIEKYKDLPEEDFILIYPYLWEEHPENHINAYIVINKGNSQIASEIPTKAVHEANSMLEKMLNDFRSFYNESDL